MAHKTSYVLASGENFGSWVVKDPEPTWNIPSGKKYYTPFYKCECVCGTIKLVQGYTLKAGKSKSCGCRWKLQVLGNNPNFKGHKGLSHSYYGRTRRGAAERGHSFDLSIEDAWNLLEAQNFKCALTGKPIAFDKLVDKGGTASLDRINSKDGYRVGNVQWVHKDVNLMKNHFDQTYFVSMCAAIVKHKGVLCD